MRATLLEELARRSPVAALQQICTYLAALNKSDDTNPVELLRITFSLETAAVSCLRMATQEYLTHSANGADANAERIAHVARIYAEQIGALYRLYLAQYRVGASGFSTIASQLARITCKAIRAYTLALKWSLIRYRAIEHTFWRELGDLYRFSESMHFAAANVVIQRGETTTVKAEFLRAAMMAACSPDTLLPAQIEMVDRILARSCGDFLLEHPHLTSLPYVVDLCGESAPRRHEQRRRLRATHRRFGPGLAYERLREADEFMQRSGFVPTSLAVSDVMDREVVHATVRHLLRCWSPELKRRHGSRQLHVERVTVVHQYEEVVANMSALFHEADFVSNEEAWVLEDQSEEGYAAFVRNPAGSWLTVGSLIALKRDEGASWSAGIVRRLSVDEQGNRYVGLEMLARGGAPAMIYDAGSFIADKVVHGPQLCVLLPTEQLHTKQTRLLMPVNRFSDSRPLVMTLYGKSYVLAPVSLLQRGDDFEVRSYRILGEHRVRPAT